MHGVTPSLFIGNLQDAQKPPKPIEGLLFVAEEYDISPPNGMLFSKIPLKEFAEADPEHLKGAVEWMEAHAADSRVMVCCRAGMGRSVSVVIAYFCCVRGMSYEEAVLFIKTRRPGATPLPNLEATIKRVQELRAIRQK